MPPKKRTVKKSASKKTKSQGGSHSKVVRLSVSIGSHDRDRTYEEFLDDIKSRLGAVPYGEDGNHVTVTGGYYILNGKACLPDDYDPETQDFKPGATPPSWAGGVEESAKTVKSQIEKDFEELSRDAYDKKYGLGKYKNQNKGKIITPEMQRAHRDKLRAQKQEDEEAELEEFDWDEDDVFDDEKLGKVADESASAAVKKMKSSKRKVVKKKPVNNEPAKKRVVKKRKK